MVRVLIWTTVPCGSGGDTPAINLGMGTKSLVVAKVTNLWTTGSLAGAPAIRNYHSAVWTESEMIVWGGCNGTQALRDGAIYNPGTNTWRATNNTNAPSARYREPGCGDKMIFADGKVSV